MTKFLFSIFAVPIGIILVLFSLNNRDSVVVDLWPLPFVMEIKIFLLVMFSLAIGGIIAVLWQLLTNFSKKTIKMVKNYDEN